MINKDIRDIILFSSIAILSALIVDYTAYLTGGMSTITSSLIWGFVRMYTPTIAVLIVGGWGYLKKCLKIDRRVVLVFLAAPFITFISLLIYLAMIIIAGVFTPHQLESLLSSSSIDFSLFLVLTFFNGYIVSLTLNAIFALGEEIGWRGFLLDKVQSTGMSLIKSSIIVGALWGLWHASAIVLLGHNYPDNRIAGVFLFVVFTVSSTLPHIFVRLISSSVLPAASLHGSINAVWGLTIITTELPREVAGLGPLAFASWILVSIALYLLLVKGKALGMHPQGPY